MSYVVKKIRPYPIPTQLSLEGEAFAGDIRKLTLIGVLLSTYFSKLKPHDMVVANFELPVCKVRFESQKFKVVKLYQRFEMETAPEAATTIVAGEATAPVVEKVEEQNFHYIIELHFENLSYGFKQEIAKFLRQISQRQS